VTEQAKQAAALGGTAYFINLSFAFVKLKLISADVLSTL
jgi:hypothetical protein